MTKNHLTEKQEILLGKFFDGEANLLERIQVRWLVEKNSSAITYLEDLESTNKLLRKYYPTPEVSLWSVVSANIHKSDKFKKNLQPSLFQSLMKLFPKPLGYGLVGAVTASTLFLINGSLFFSSSNSVTFDSFQPTKQRIQYPISQVSSVDWFRSSGKVERFNSIQGKSPVVFVRKKIKKSEQGLPILAERNSFGVVITGNR
jgi:hypothetical protein